MCLVFALYPFAGAHGGGPWLNVSIGKNNRPIIANNAKVVIDFLKIAFIRLILN